MPTAKLHWADSERDADLYYLTRFLAGDPFLYLEVDGKREIFLKDLELDRGRRESAVEVVRLQEIIETLKARSQPPRDAYERVARQVGHIAGARGVDAFEVPPRFPVALADALRALGFQVAVAPIAPDRACKGSDEVEKIRAAIRCTEGAMELAIDRIRRAEIRDGLLFEESEPLTSERVRFGVEVFLLEQQCFAYDAIVAGGDQGTDPHERGHGPLPAHSPIILDIFPRHNPTRYHGDMTRTVVRGEASPRVREMFHAVAAAKAKAESLLRDGVDGFDVHKAVQQVFVDAGFETGEKNGRMEGFFHGTGHGLGLDVHEAPHLGAVHDTIRAGHVVTVEPGLYYPGHGGVRIEDDVLVTETGCENLCTLEAFLEI